MSDGTSATPIKEKIEKDVTDNSSVSVTPSKVNDINFALVEEKRPAIYTAMKYWGKKPHNIWRQYIDNYTPKDGVFLDPFTGCAMSAFESYKVGRKAIAFDLNPLSSFLIEVISSDFTKAKFEKQLLQIVEAAENDETYQKYFETTCDKCHQPALAQHYKWDGGKLYELGYICSCQNGKPTKYLKQPSAQDLKLAETLPEIDIPFWYPDKEFHKSPSFSASFIRNLGGNHFFDLWTRRNLYVLSKIFNLILEVSDPSIKQQLLFGFIQSLHLCSKMCVPRRPGANRPFSTSWGRSAYICAERQMEMNPLLVFKSSCIGKQSVESALTEAQQYLGGKPRLQYVDRSNRSIRSNSYDIRYGIVDVAGIDEFVDEKTIDFILTDPPYGGLVQYLDLSSLWLVWLERWDKRMKPDYDSEITIKTGQQELELYRIKFTNALKKLHKVLKDDGKLVITFHNQDLRIWNSFLNSIMLAGFTIEKVIHQQNRRTGESNVANPYGTSASDFYIRCIKAPSVSLKTDKEEFEHYVVKTAIRLIAERNEPTPYQILFNGLLAEISKAGFDIEDFDTNIEKVLSKNIGSTFTLRDNDDKKAGSYWWFVDPAQHIKYPDRSLADRVEDTVVRLLRRKIRVSLDEVLAEIFIKYPNGLTPTASTVTRVLRKYANRANDKWVYKGGEIEQQFTKHSEAIYDLTAMGKKLGYEVYIGKREQPEPYNGARLGSFASFGSLSGLELEDNAKRRAEMIDALWIKDGEIVCALEVENSTNFTSGIQRASNLNQEIPKLMVIPDYRVKEIEAIKDKLFLDNFKKYNWTFLTYTDVKKLVSSRSLNWQEIKIYEKNLD